MKNSFHADNFTRLMFQLLLIGITLFSSHLVIGQEDTNDEIVKIPEPLMFDLVRGLGARRGELEINSLAEFPLNQTSDRGVDWAPEIEYALFNDFAVELEFPLNNFDLEAYKGAIQWTIGAGRGNKFIHGIQVLGEKYVHNDLLELNFLYVPAYRFNENWSVIGLFGLMLEYGADAAERNYTVLLNASIFRDVNENLVLGVECNNTNTMFQKIDDNFMELLVLPQLHYEFNHSISFQCGFGTRFNHGKTDASVVLRIIKTF